ncbi:MAG TPA: ATP-binding protein, partial [Lacipirellulaceae bacterium]|nr:ATP-binding protein [Lacipirellulaceae bacterium]
MLLQWAGTMIAAACLTPTTWDGDAGRLHPHINLAVFFGGAVCALPLLLAWRRPGADVTRYVIVIGQVVFSSIIIHVTGGRIESHFHVFGSLALIAAYRDWRLFVPAVGIIAADHFIRGQFWPETVYGVFTASPWRTVEHSGWVLFETIFLIYSIRLSAREMRLKALQTAHLEQSHADLQSSAEQLARSFDKERAIIDGALDAIVQMDADGVVTSWNSQAERQFGWRIAEALGRPAAELILPPRGRAEFLASIESYRTSGQAPLLGCRVEIEGQRRAGEAFPMEMAVAPIRRGDETLYCAFLRDITARRQYEENLQQARDEAEAASRCKSDFLANMSHEIRTPLNGILGFTELLIRNADGGNEAERRDYIRTIRSSGRHLLELINNILDLSKIEAGQLQLELTACSPHQLIAEVVSVLRASAQEKGISLEYSWQGAIPAAIQCDPYRLRQVLMNLVGNAVKFTSQGSVHVRAELHAGGPAPQLSIAVEDTGIGISPQHIESIFSPFVQADGSVTRQFGGTGLGLAISRNICQALGGRLDVVSQLGRGSTFTIVIPTGSLDDVDLCEQPPEQPVGDVVDTRENSENLAGLSVLLADDGETNRKLIHLFLSRQGARVVAVENGELAVSAALAQPFDVILMDMQMPVMDGYAATRKLR